MGAGSYPKKWGRGDVKDSNVFQKTLLSLCNEQKVKCKLLYLCNCSHCSPDVSLPVNVIYSYM